MHSIKMWIEEHPYLAGVLVLGIVVLFIVIRRSSSATAASGGTVYSGPSDQIQAMQLQAGSQIQGAQIAAQAQVAGFNASVNAKALDAAANIKLADIQAGSQDYMTAAGLQLGLAGLGFTPSNSPFGLTRTIVGVDPANYVPGRVINPSVPTPISPSGIDTPPVQMAVVTSNPNSPVRGYGTPSQIAGEFSGVTLDTTHAGNGTYVTVPSVPIYGPGGVNLGDTPVGSIPSSSGLTWQQYNNAFNTQDHSSVQPGSVAYATAANIAAQLDYLNNPLSCHNRDCHHG